MTNIWNKIRSLNEKRTKKLKGPKELPQQVGSYLVTQKSINPDEAWALRCVLKPTEEKNQYEFRVFNPSQVIARKFKVQDFYSLDNQPELILYQGTFVKFTNKVQFLEEIDHHAA